MRSSISAQSCASVPPAPAWMSTNAFARIHLAGEHALEFELLDFRAEILDVVGDGRGRAFVVFADRKIEQIAGLAERIGQRADAADDALEIRALLAELLRALRVVPDVRVFELARDFLEALGLRIEVKDTP